MIFFIKKWFKRRHFFIDEKNLQKLGLTGELISVNSYYMTIRSFQSQFLVLQVVNQWLTVVNFCVIVVSNYLTTVQQCLTMYLLKNYAKNYVLLERSSLDKAKVSIKPLKQQKC